MSQRVPKPTREASNDNPAPAPDRQDRSRRRVARRPPKRPRPAPEIRPLPLAPGGADYLRASVYFDLDEDRLGGPERSLLERAAFAVNGRDAELIRVTGHADPSGSEVHNGKLSDRRAESVVGALNSRLRPSHRDAMYSIGLGESEPADGPERCRRVDITATAEPGPVLPADPPQHLRRLGKPVEVSPEEQRSILARWQVVQRALTPERRVAMMLAGVNIKQLEHDIAHGVSLLNIDDRLHRHAGDQLRWNKANGVGTECDDLTAIGPAAPAHIRHAAAFLEFRIEVLSQGWEAGLTTEGGVPEQLAMLRTSLTEFREDDCEPGS